MVIREYRIEDIPGIANVKINSWQSTYLNLIPNHVLESLSQENEEEQLLKFIKEQENMLGYVVENDQGEIIGYILGGEERTGNREYTGEIYAIYLLKQYQRQGIGNKLLRTFCEALGEKGINSMLVWVLQESPHRQFYSSLGGKEINYQTHEHECTKYNLVAYGWEKIPWSNDGEIL